MFTKTIGNTTIHFGPLIIFAMLLGTILLLQVIRSIVLEQKFKKIIKYMSSGNYSDIPQIGESLLSKYLNYTNRIKTRTLLSKIEYLNFALAVSYFALSNDERFLNKIHKLNQSPDVKEFWLSLYFLQKEDFEEFKAHSNQITCSDETYINRTYLNAYCSFKQHQKNLAYESMSLIFDSLKHPILKDLAKSVLSQENTGDGSTAF